MRGTWNRGKDFKMAALKDAFVLLRLFHPAVPRKLMFGSQKSAFSFNLVQKLATETQKRLETEQDSQETKLVEQPEHAELSSKTRAKVGEFLERNGIRVKNIRKQVDISKLSVKKIAQIFRFLGEIGIDREHRRNVITRRPTILTTKEVFLKNRVQAMRNTGIYPESITYIVKEAPGVLTARTEETLPGKVKYFEDMKVTPKFTKDEILHVLTKCPSIIATYNVESLRKKVQFLEQELKFNKDHVKNIILKQPSVLTFSPEALKEKWTYCYEKINVSPSSIARCPRMFQCSLKRIKERHLYLKHLGHITDEMKIDDYGLGLIVTNSDKRFAEKVARMSLDEFDEFRNNIDWNEQ